MTTGSPMETCVCFDGWGSPDDVAIDHMLDCSQGQRRNDTLCGNMSVLNCESVDECRDFVTYRELSNASRVTRELRLRERVSDQGTETFETTLKNSHSRIHRISRVERAGQRTCASGRASSDMPFEDDRAHALRECSNNGLCDRVKGECRCYTGWAGTVCQRRACANDCSGTQARCPTTKASAIEDFSLFRIFRVWGFETECTRLECTTESVLESYTDLEYA